MTKFITDNSTGAKRSQLHTEWKRNCKEEEEKSKQIYARNEEFLKENLTDEPRKRKSNKPEERGNSEQVRNGYRRNFRQARKLPGKK